jgi:hypothetical protein
MKHISDSRTVQQILVAKKESILTPSKVLVISLALFIGILIILVITENNQLLLLENGSWTELPRLSDSIKKIEIDKKGTLWAQLSGGSGLYRYEKDKWTSFPITAFTSYSDDLHNFAISDSGLWAVTQKNVFLFDGIKWQSHSRANDVQNHSEIVANGNQIWVVGSSNTIHHFNGIKWDALEYNSLVRPKEDRIFCDSSSNLWLTNQSVWRNRNSKWKQIVENDVVHRPEIIAIIDDYLWLKEDFLPLDELIREGDKKIARVSLKDKKVKIFSVSDLGINEGAKINATVSDNEILVYDTEKILVYRNKKWRNYLNLPRLPDNFHKIITLHPSGKNSFIALAQVNLGFISILDDNEKTITFLFIVEFLAILLWMDWSEQKKKAKGVATIKQISEMIDAGNKLIYAQKKTTVERKKKNKLVFIIVLITSFLGFLPIILLIRPLCDFIELVGDYSVILGVLITLLFTIFYILYLMWLKVVPIHYLLMPLRKGNYDLAIKRTIKMLKIGQQGADEVYGTILTYAGKLNEAEKVFCKPLLDIATCGDNTESKTLSSLVAAYARTLLWSGRLKEAENMSQKAVEISSKHHESFIGLAEAYLCRKDRSLEALTLIEKAISLQKFERLFFPYLSLRIYSAQAWALAQLEQFDQAEESLSLAIKKGGGKFIPEVALVHLRGSIVHGLAGKKDLSYAELQKAYELDPKGFVGQKAKEVMSRQSIGQFDYGF